MKPALRVFLLTLLISCNTRFDPNTNIEATIHPQLPGNEQDREEFIDSNLHAMYPNIGKYQIKIVNKGYKTGFFIGGNDFTVRFDSTGKWISSKVDIRYQSRLPDGIKEKLEDPLFKDWLMIGRKLTETPDTLYYKLEFKRKEEHWDLFVDKEGELLRKKKKIKKTITG